MCFLLLLLEDTDLRFSGLLVGPPVELSRPPPPPPPPFRNEILRNKSSNARTSSLISDINAEFSSPPVVGFGFGFVAVALEVLF